YPDLKTQIVRTNLSDLQNESKQKLENLAKQNSKESKTELENLVNFLLPSAIQLYLTNEYNLALKKNIFFLWGSFIMYILGTMIVLFLLFNKSFNVLFN
ncbi:MAG: hypothetical protein K2Q22_00210, partial [Cytophagales bacterium]|nr:hypothetical protein [Cytophagales bacterium]